MLFYIIIFFVDYILAIPLKSNYNPFFPFIAFFELKVLNLSIYPFYLAVLISEKLLVILIFLFFFLNNFDYLCPLKPKKFALKCI
jgi:hypothetical protein